MTSMLVALTIRLDQTTVDEADRIAKINGSSRSNVLRDAARHALLVAPSERDAEGERSNQRLLSRIEALERNLESRVSVLTELVAIFHRSFLNHTPEVPPDCRADRSESGRIRFEKVLDHLEKLAQDGTSILKRAES